MSCGCSTGKSCGCQFPFPWHGEASGATPSVPMVQPGKCPPGFQRLAAFRRGHRVAACMPNGKRRLSFPGIGNVLSYPLGSVGGPKGLGGMAVSS